MDTDAADENHASAEEGLALIEAFQCLHDAKLRWSLITLAQALAVGDVGAEALKYLRRLEGPRDRRTP